MLVPALQDILDGTFDRSSVRSVSVPLAILLSVAGVAWYHLGVFRADQADLEGLDLTADAVVHRVVVLASPTSTVPDQLAESTLAEVRRWDRLDDGAEPPFDASSISADIASSDTPDILVLAADAGWKAIPLTTPLPTMVAAAAHDLPR